MIIDEETADEILSTMHEVEYEIACFKDEIELIERKFKKIKTLLEM